MDQASLLVNIFLLLIFFFFFFFAFNFFIRTRTRYKNLPPTPPYSLPIIGHLHLLKHTVLHRSLHSLSQTYGPIISLNFGSRRIAVVSSSSAAEECFTKNDIVLANRPRLLVSKYLGYNYTTIVSSPYGDHWRNLRRIGAIEIFSTNRLNMFSNIRRDEIKRLLCKLSQNSLHDFAKVELKSMFTELTFNITMRMIAGKRYYGDEVNNNEEALQFREIMREIFTLSGAGNLGDFIPILNWIGSQSFEKRIIEIGKRVDSFLQSLIEEARGKMGKQNTIIDHLLALQQSQPEYYTDQTIKGFVLVMLLAGTDTSAVTLEWAMSILLNHPNVLNKAKMEFNTKIGNKKLLEEAETSNLPYLQSIISETMRLYPAVPLLLPHYSSDDCVIGGYDLPRDTTFLVNVWAIQRDPKLWEDPECFKPERFEIDDNKNEGYKLMPFGMGRRACPGAALAQRILSLTLGSLIQCFEWKRVGEKEIDMTEGKGLTMPKVLPLEVMCKACPIMENVLSDQFMDDV